MHLIKRTISSGDKRIIQSFDGEWRDIAGPMSVDETREWLIEDIHRETE